MSSLPLVLECIDCGKGVLKAEERGIVATLVSEVGPMEEKVVGSLLSSGREDS